MTQAVFRLILGFWAALWALFVVGCAGGLAAPSGFPKEFGAVAKTMTDQVADQGVMDEFLSHIRGSIQDPGIETYIRNELVVGARIAGVNGDITLDTAGTGTQLPSGVRESLIGQLAHPISDEQRAAILDLLGWNRKVSPHNPVPGRPVPNGPASGGG